MPRGNAVDYSVVFATVGLAGLEEEAIRLSRTLDADGTPAQASIVRQAFLHLLTDLREIAVRISQLAEEAIKADEAATRVRPDTGGGGGARLGDFVGISDPLHAVEGSVGVNYEPELYANVPWWWTNEEGSSVHVGREVTGFFQPGSSRPGAAPSRTHPLFRATGKGPTMTIENPIPERGFVQSGSNLAETVWHAKIRQAKSRFLRQCEMAMTASVAARRARAKKPRR